MVQGWFLVLALLASAAAADPATVRVNSFPNAKALPLHAGVAKGIFARRDLALQLSFTENSAKQREGLAAGEFDIVHSAVDNAVAMECTMSISPAASPSRCFAEFSVKESCRARPRLAKMPFATPACRGSALAFGKLLTRTVAGSAAAADASNARTRNQP